MVQPTTEPIEALIERLKAGDADAFAEVICAYEWPLRTWIVANCPPGGDADDVAQRTFIEVFRGIGRYQPGTDFAAWLYTVARYQLLAESTRVRRIADYHRRYAPAALSAELERRAAADPEVSPQLDHLRACLESIAGPARDLLTWRYTDDLPLIEIAERAGRSVAAVKKQLFLLRGRLHDCMVARAQVRS